MTNMKIACIWTGDNLGFTDPRDGEQYVVPNTHTNYTAIKHAVQGQDIETAVSLFNVRETLVRQLSQTTATVGNVTIKDGKVMFKGIEVHNKITELILNNLREGFDITRYANFMVNLLENPSFASREQLHGFIEKYLFDITEDGRFYAYKVINEDWTDVHTGKFNNSVGTTVTMLREEVDDDPNVTCSRGLHVCGRSYVNQFKRHNNRLVMVAVNPRDVVCIPKDYQHAKIRCCEYEVIGEVNDMFQQQETGETHGRVVKHQVRDAKGRFTSKMAFEPTPEEDLDRTW